MTVKELKQLLNEYPDEMLVLVKAEDGGEVYAYDISSNVTRANVEYGDIISEENDFDEDETDESDFDEKDCILLLDSAR